MEVLFVARLVTLPGKTLPPGVYEIGPAQVTREEADTLVKQHPDWVRVFADNEPIANLAEWKKQNTFVKS